jgi:hypothetical protein
MDVSPTNIRPPDPQMMDPVLRYRLDPLEPGLLRSARASQSVAAVSTHELGNLIEFRREAAQTGRMVVYSSITFSRGIDGIYPSLRAGRTEVVSVPLPEPYSPPPPQAAAAEPPAQVPVVTEEDNPDDISRKEIELLATLATLENRLEMKDTTRQTSPSEVDYSQELTNLKVDMGTDSPDAASGETDALNPSSRQDSTDTPPPATRPEDATKADEKKVEDTQAKHIEQHYKQEMNRVKAQLNEIRMAKLRENIDKLSEVLSDIITSNISILSRLVKVANSMGPDSRLPSDALEIPTAGTYLNYFV